MEAITVDKSASGEVIDSPATSKLHDQLVKDYFPLSLKAGGWSIFRVPVHEAKGGTLVL